MSELTITALLHIILPKNKKTQILGKKNSSQVCKMIRFVETAYTLTSNAGIVLWWFMVAFTFKHKEGPDLI